MVLNRVEQTSMRFWQPFVDGWLIYGYLWYRTVPLRSLPLSVRACIKVHIHVHWTMWACLFSGVDWSFFGTYHCLKYECEIHNNEPFVFQGKRQPPAICFKLIINLSEIGNSYQYGSPVKLDQHAVAVKHSWDLARVQPQPQAVGKGEQQSPVIYWTTIEIILINIDWSIWIFSTWRTHAEIMKTW